MNQAIVLGWIEMAAALGLFACTILLSWRSRLQQERTMVLAAFRMTVQLLILGVLLRWLFAVKLPVAVLTMAAFMAAIAAFTAVRRTRYRYPGIWFHTAGSIFLTAGFVAGVTVLFMIPVRPWYEPRYLIPILGMIMGNMMNGVALSLDSLLAAVHQNRQRIETDLALGASGAEALAPEMRDAARTGMMPILNAMLVMGLVSLPGMMTGQILAGAPPMQAVRYQIVIVLVVASGIFAAVQAILLMARRQLCNAQGELKPGTPV